MTLILPHSLPAANQLRKQGIQVLTPDEASNQDIRPLRIGLLNLMPSAVKQRVELQIAHALHSPLQIRLLPIWFDRYKSETLQPYLDRHYSKITDIQREGLDGLIITGANLEHMPFDQVKFFQELRDFMNWADTSVVSTIYSCWSAHARLFVDYDLQRSATPRKLSGVFTHTVDPDILTYGLDDLVSVPHSRNTQILREHIHQSGLRILMESQQAGWHLATDDGYRRIFLQGHPEYDTTKLHEEYVRDKSEKEKTEIPRNYYPYDDTTQTPRNTWRANSQIFFGNWLNIIYQKISQN